VIGVASTATGTALPGQRTPGARQAVETCGTKP
jgi:hypothetical protein